MLLVLKKNIYQPNRQSAMDAKEMLCCLCRANTSTSQRKFITILESIYFGIFKRVKSGEGIELQKKIPSKKIKQHASALSKEAVFIC
jgi:hypothetical protein